MQVRPFEPADAPALAALFHASVHRIGIRDYSPGQCAAWSPAEMDPARFVAHADGREFLVAEDPRGRVAGYGVLEPNGHIDKLYVDPDFAGTGIGSLLCDAIERAAKSRGMTLLFTEASEAARRLFERRGFTLDGRNGFALNGVAIHNYRMSKPIG